MAPSRTAQSSARASTRRLAAATGGGVITRTLLPGGLRVVTEAMPGVRSASVGIWVPVGSRDESVSLAGTSHFLEHLLFKGTTTRTALDIASTMDTVGGEFNAFTEKEHTCFYATVLDRDLDVAIDIVTDVVLNATITAQDVDIERGVVLEEIAMRDDDPGRPGARRVLRRPVRRPPARAFRSSAPKTRSGADAPPGRRVLPAALHTGRDGGRRRRERRARRSGAARAPRVRRQPRPPADLAAAALGRERGRDGAPGTSGRAWSPTTPSRPTSSSACHGLSRHDPRRYALGVLSSALGGGMSSRLFQRIREERGLAYSVYSFSSALRRRRPVRCVRRVPAGQGRRGALLMVAELDSVAAGDAHRGRDRARQGPDARRHRARAWRTSARG